MTKHKALSIFLIALVVTLVAAGVLQAQSNRSMFGWVIANRATIQDGGLAVTGDTVLADADMVGAVTVSGDLATDNLALSAQTAITLTSAATLTPTGSYQPIQAAGNIGFGAITVGAAGTVLTIINVSNTTITITDTGTLKLSGNAALAQYDAIQLMSDGTNWIQTAPEGDN